jgi:hypothetical protein
MFGKKKKKKRQVAGRQWLAPVILAAWEAEVMRIFKAGTGKQFLRPHLQNNHSKMD